MTYCRSFTYLDLCDVFTVIFCGTERRLFPLFFLTMPMSCTWNDRRLIVLSPQVSSRKFVMLCVWFVVATSVRGLGTSVVASCYSCTIFDSLRKRYFIGSYLMTTVIREWLQKCTLQDSVIKPILQNMSDFQVGIVRKKCHTHWNKILRINWDTATN